MGSENELTLRQGSAGTTSDVQLTLDAESQQLFRTVSCEEVTSDGSSRTDAFSDADRPDWSEILKTIQL